MEHLEEFNRKLAVADEKTKWALVGDITQILSTPGHEASVDNRLFMMWYTLLKEVQESIDNGMNEGLKPRRRGTRDEY